MKHVLKSTKYTAYVSSMTHDCYAITEDITKALRLTENEAHLHVINTTYGDNKIFEVVKVEV